MADVMSKPFASARTGKVAVMLLAPAVILLTVMFALPLCVVFKTSVVTQDGFTLKSFARFLSDPFYLGILERTFRLGLLGMFLTLLPGYILAYIMAFHPSERFRLFVTIMALIPLVVNLVVRVFGWLAVLSSEGVIFLAMRGLGFGDDRVQLLYSETAILIGFVHSHITFMALPIAAALARIDYSYLRAAQNLGASPPVIFFRIVLPLSIPGVVAGCMICFALNISDFVAPALLGGERVRMMTYLIYEQQLYLANQAFAAAQTVVLTVTTLIAILGGMKFAALFARRYAA